MLTDKKIITDLFEHPWRQFEDLLSSIVEVGITEEEAKAVFSQLSESVQNKAIEFGLEDVVFISMAHIEISNKFRGTNSTDSPNQLTFNALLK